MSEDTWLTARLIPTSGINGAPEQERRATSALLAVMSSVREFGRALTQPLGAPAGPLQAFIEVPFKHQDKQCFPDGLIRVVRGQRQWTALVEVKTAGNELQAEQLERYLVVARRVLRAGAAEPQAVDAGAAPVAVDGRTGNRARSGQLDVDGHLLAGRPADGRPSRPGAGGSDAGRRGLTDQPSPRAAIRLAG